MEGTRDRELGRRIAALRTARGWSQGWLASQAGMTQSVLSRVEAGKRETRASELADLARALGVGPESLLEGAEQASVGTAAQAAEVESAEGHAAALEAAALEASVFEASPVETAAFQTAAFHAAPREAEDRLAACAPDEVALADMASGFPVDASAPPATREQALSLRVDQSMPGPMPFAARADHRAASRRRAAPSAFPALPDLPPLVAEVIVDYLRLRSLAVTDERPWGASWQTFDSLGRRRPAGKPTGWQAGRPAAAVNWNEPRDRYARLWRHELGIGVDGPVPDLVALFEDAGLAEVIVARLGGDGPVCANVTIPAVAEAGAAGSRRAAPAREPGTDAVSFIFVNADRPVALQRHALVHAFAHLVLGHGDVVDGRIEWSRATPPEAEANDFAEEFLAPVDAVARWYDRHDDPAPSTDVLLGLAGAFGITFWAALYRSRAAGRLGPKPFARLQRELRARQWQLLPEQSLRGGLRDTLSTLSEEVPLPPPGAEGVGGVPAPRTRDQAAAPRPGHAPGARATPAVLRVPARLRVWTLEALRGGLLSLEQAAGVLRRPPAALAAELERLGIE